MKFFTTQRLTILIILCILAFAFFHYSNNKSYKSISDGMEDGSAKASTEVSPSAVDGNLRPVATPSDLLPKDKNAEWSAMNPSFTHNNVLMPDLLEAGYHIGLDTIGNTMKNPNYQLRSDPIIPKMDVGPWNQSTYGQDLARVPLELGSH